MPNPTRIKRFVVALAIAAATAAGPLAHVAHAEPAGPEVPSDISVPDGNKVFLVTHAVGVQIYSCRSTAGGFGWGLVAPRAELRGDNGKLIATHYGGPTWETRDGSTVVGSRMNGITVDQTAIPWLLLSAASRTAGSDGDRLAHTTFIQRTATTGGL